MAEFTNEQKIACIDRSPAAVAVHDKAAWLALFAGDCLVNDPVGSKPHEGHKAIARFYDSFIAPNEISFDVQHDTVCGNTVVRDLTIETTMSTGLQVSVSTHIRYQLIEQDGELKIHRLYAHWELLPMVLHTLRQGVLGLVTYAKLSVHMIRCQGLGGVLGFTRGFGGVGKRGKVQAQAWLSAISQGDSAAAGEQLATGAQLHLPDAEQCSLDQVLEQMQGVQWRKVIAAGKTITATINQAERQGVVYLLVDRKGKIIEARFYLQRSG